TRTPRRNARSRGNRRIESEHGCRRRRTQIVIIATLGKLRPPHSRALAVALLFTAILLVLVALLLPIVLLHNHYDNAIASLSDRLERYRRVAAQAPEYRKALDAMRERDGRRFFLKNTAPNLAGAELQELARGAIEGNGGRITT